VPILAEDLDPTARNRRGIYDLLVGTSGAAHFTCMQEEGVWSGAGSSSLVDEHEQVNLYPIENIMSTLNIRGKILTFLKP